MTAIAISSSEFRKDCKKYFDMLETTKVFIRRGKKYVELVPRDNIELPSENSLSRFAGAWSDDDISADDLVEQIRSARTSNRQIEEL